MDESLEALWTVEFVSDLEVAGAGVVVFETDRVFGGDAQYYYTGIYEVHPDGTVEGEVHVRHYAGAPYSVFGYRKNFSVKVSGKPQTPVMELEGTLIEDPPSRLRIRLTRRAELP